MKEYYCDSCVYSRATNDYTTRWCEYWGKVVFVTDGCSLDDDLLDDGFDGTYDED